MAQQGSIRGWPTRTNRTFASRTLRVAAVAMCATAALSACGGGGDGGGGTGAAGGGGGGDSFTPEGGFLLPIGNVRSVASGGGRLWIVSGEDVLGLKPEAFEIDKGTGEYSGLDAEGNVLDADIEFSSGTPQNVLTAGGDEVWASADGGACLRSIDPKTGKESDAIDLGDTPGCGEIEYGHDAVWSTSNSLNDAEEVGLTQVKEGKATEVEVPGEGYLFTSVGPDAVYVVRNEKLHRIDPESLEVTKSVDVDISDGKRYSVVATPDGVWVLDWDSSDSDVIARRFDLDSLEVSGTVTGATAAKAGEIASPAVYRDGGVWALNGESRPVRWDASAGDDAEVQKWNGSFEGSTLAAAGGELYLLGDSSLIWYDVDEHEPDDS